MALPTSDISTADVRNLLGASGDDIFPLSVLSNINKWSRFKPIRDIGFGPNWPAGSNGKYGLNLPTNWDYLQPRGGSIGGSPDEGGRLDDFRGYEHDKDIAGPVTWIIAGSPTLNGNLIPHTAPSGYLSGAVSFGMNVAHEDVRIIPSDLGFSNYYFGLRLTLPGGGYRYKTVGSVLANAQAVGVNVTLTSYEDLDPAFTDCPYAIGEFQWDAFICSEIKAAWTSVAPADIIYLPTGTFGSKSIVNHGTFTVKDWLISGDSDMSWTWGLSGLGQCISTVIYTSLSTPWLVKSIPAWLTYKVYDEGGTLDLTGSPSMWASGSILKLYPTAPQVYDAPLRSGSVILGNSTVDMEEIVVSQDAAPSLYIAGVGKWASDSSALSWSSVSADIVEGTSTVRVTMNKTAGPTTIYYKVFYHGVQVHGGIVTGWNNGSSTKNLSASSIAGDSSLPIMVVLSGDPMI